MRFKIDLYVSCHAPFGLYVSRRGASWLWVEKWELIDRFATRDEAKAFYDKIKDLPEYLA